MTQYHPYNGGKALAAFALTQQGKGYSMQSPNGSDGDGHLWHPGETLPIKYDCSGLVVTSCVKIGIAINRGSAQDQWLQHLGGVVPDSQKLKTGDLGFFMGAENVRGYAGHVGIVVSYNHVARIGTIINAYDTQRGVCLIPFNRDQLTNESNGLGVIGFTRPSNSLPRLIPSRKQH